MVVERTQRLMSASTEQVFRQLPDGLFREITLHFINFLNEDRKITSSKLDREIVGRLFKLARSDAEKSKFGEVKYTFPGGDGKPVRLLCLGDNYYENLRYGRS